MENIKFIAIILLCTLGGGVQTEGQVPLPYVDFPSPTKPGMAQGTVTGNTLTLENDVIRMSWSSAGNQLVPLTLADKLAGTTVNFTGASTFRLKFSNGTEWGHGDFNITALPGEFSRFNALDPQHIRLANRMNGSSLEVTLRSAGNEIEVTWKAILLDNTNYIRQEFSFKNLQGGDQMVSHYYLINQNGLNPVISGTVAGSPVVDGNFFMGLESPYAFNNIDGNNMQFWIKKTSPLAANATYSHSTVMGVAPADQMRRAFLYYISLERPHYYRQFTHFNAWYDSPFNYTEPWLTETVNTLSRELGTERGLPVHSYVIDDGWDDPNNSNTWTFNGNLPSGFQNVLPLAHEQNAGFGVWMSPFGGYAGREARMSAAEAYGGETKVDTITGSRLFSLAGNNYYTRYKQATLDLIQDHGLNFLKAEFGMWDTYREQFQDDSEALMRLADTLRVVKPDFYLNASSGTYPSPFWLKHLESTWRSGGGDAPNLVRDFTGDHKREHWIGGRDYSTYTSVVQRGPLYPVSSLMLHGITIGTSIYPADYPNDMTSITHEVRSFYGSGVSCSELYISHSILTDEMYDVIAEAGKWAYNNRDILEDAHWIGGNPGNGDVYGRAGWNKRGGYIYVRNPTIYNKDFTFDIDDLFELPEGAQQKYFLKSPWAEDAGDALIEVNAGSSHTFSLGPLEVLVYDARPEVPYVPVKQINEINESARFSKISPNPFRNSITLEFLYGGTDKITTEIFDVNGKVVKRSLARKVSNNEYRISWNGLDELNKGVNAGIYFMQINIGESQTLTKRLIKIQ